MLKCELSEIKGMHLMHGPACFAALASQPTYVNDDDLLTFIHIVNNIIFSFENIKKLVQYLKKYCYYLYSITNTNYMKSSKWIGCTAELCKCKRYKDKTF